MRLRHRETILCLSFLIQVTFAYQKNDYLKNNQRTNPKKYYPTSLTTSTTSRSVDNKFKVDSTNVKLRHSSSKFPNFDKIKSRIAGLDSDSSASSGRTRASSDLSTNKNRYSDNRFYSSDSRLIFSDPYPRLRHHGWSNRARTTTSTTTSTASPDEDLFNTYGDMEEGDDDEEAQDDDPNYDDDIFNTVKDPEEDNNKDTSIKAEEITERSTPEPRKYSSLTEYKWRQLGTYEKVHETRKKYLKSPEENSPKAVLDHFIRVQSQSRCKKPIPKVIPVHLEHPDPSVTYIPECTVLHRCAEDTGCCKWDTTCQYKERVPVNLYFYVNSIGAEYTEVKSLTFYNHTECECRDKQEENPEDDTTTEREKRVAQRSAEDQTSSNYGISLKSGTSFRSNSPENLQKCKCPKEYTPKIRYNSKCFCDCKEDDQDCLRMKTGKEYIGIIDRICILKKQCAAPSCEYGLYTNEKGRCPRNNEV